MPDRKKAWEKSLPPELRRKIREAKRDVKKLRACGVHEFSMDEVKKVALDAFPLSWTKAKVRCHKCGVSFFALYAGGYLDALRDSKKKGSEPEDNENRN